MKKKLFTLGITLIMIMGVFSGCQSSSAGNNGLDTDTINSPSDSAKNNTEDQNSENNANAGTQDSQVVLRIGAQPFPLYSSIYVAKAQGFLDEELLAVGATYEWPEFTSGPLVNEAAAAGAVDIGFMADMPAIIAKSSGQDIQIIANVAYGEEALALLVPVDSDIWQVSDLAGKNVAYVTGSYAQHLLALLLDGAGLTFDDINTINLAASDQQSALESGQVDAVVVWEQYISLFESQGIAKVIADGTGIKKGNMVTYAVKDYAEAHPEVIEAYIRACQRASDFINKNPREAAESVADVFGVTADLMEQILAKFNFDPNLTAEDIAEITTVKDYILEENIIENDVDIDEFINTDYITSSGIND